MSLTPTRKSFTTKVKLAAIRHFDSCGSQSETAREFNVSQSMISRWLQSREIIIKSDHSKRKIGSGRSAIHRELEQAVYQWLLAQREKKIAVKYVRIRSAAKRIANNKKINVDGFKFSDNWINRFCRRYSLSSRCKTHQAQENQMTKEEKMEKVSDYLKSVRHFSSTYDACNIINMDETPVYIDMPHRRTIHPKGSKTVDMVTTGHEKTRFTVSLTVKADGTVLSAFVIFRGLKKIPKVIKPSNVHIEVSDSGSMDQYLMQKYIKEILQPTLN